MAKPTLGLPNAKPAAPIAPQATAPEMAAPYLGAPVVVITSGTIGGQSEHAAIVTRVHSGDLVNVMVFPGEGQPYPVASINREAGAPSWRWPSRN